MDLTQVFPQPEPVGIGSRRLFALPFRLIDLARLQNYCKVARPCPLDAARPAIRSSVEGSEARRRVLRDAYLACEAWPARLGSEEGRAILATDAGLKFWLTTLLGPANPELVDADLDDLVATITVNEYERLVRIGYGVAPLDELTRLITPDSFPPDRDAGKPTNWGKILRALIVETGWTFAQCGELRLTQLAAFQTDGAYGSGKVDPPRGMSHFAFSRRQKRFFGPDRDEE